MKFLSLLWFWLFVAKTWAFVEAPMPTVYSEISSLTNPTSEDLYKVQAYINEEKPILKRLEDTEFIPRQLKIISDRLDEQIEYGRLVLNTDEDDRENCIILYTSFNQKYPRGVRRLLNAIKKTDYWGHVYYRFGGWPNMDEGDLTLAHVPFAFKVCFFREMQRLGYKKVLWLDASILPFGSLNRIFHKIRNKGYFVQGNSHTVGIYMNEDTANSFGLTMKETEQIPSCSAAILGIDFSNPRAAPLIEAWYQAAKDPHAFFSPRSDQTALSILLYQMGLTDWESNRTLGSPRNINSTTLFVMDREYVKTVN